MQPERFGFTLCTMEQRQPEGAPLRDDHPTDVAAIQSLAAIPSMLEVICRVTGMGFAAVARVTDERWICCTVRDEIGFGMEPGDELDIKTTICDEIRGHREPIVIEHVAEDPIYRDHQTPRLYGFQSYISAPIVRTDGSLFGTLFAIDPKPAKLGNSSASTTFHLFTQLISLELDAEAPTGLSEP